MNNPVIGITAGDPCGVGPEIVIKSLCSPELREAVEGEGKPGSGFIPLVIGDTGVLKEARDRFAPGVALSVLDNAGLESLGEQTPGGNPDAEGKLYVYNISPPGPGIQIEKGRITASGGKSAVESIRCAVNLFEAGLIGALVTAPINKEAVRAAGYTYTGHTEMLAEMTESRYSLTLFTVNSLRTYFHTRHLSLREAIDSLTIEGVAESIQLTARCLESLGLKGRKIALAALNPHASDGGLFGDEEREILLPAVEAARRDGIPVEGPVPADSVFHLGIEGVYDAVISLYHDQGHIATKTYDFYRTVSLTLGLPFIRTSVDHGTAFNIAWQGKANHTSMTEAVLAAARWAETYNPQVFHNIP